jgi:hypothetical protein
VAGVKVVLIEREASRRIPMSPLTRRPRRPGSPRAVAYVRRLPRGGSRTPERSRCSARPDPRNPGSSPCWPAPGWTCSTRTTGAPCGVLTALGA